MTDPPQLGKQPDDSAEKDAIHMAVVPAVAAHVLGPGASVGVIAYREGEYFVGKSETPVGIVDPFYESTVLAGERCWIMLFPGTITSLRHDWEHPAFQDAENNALDQTDLDDLFNDIDQFPENPAVSEVRNSPPVVQLGPPLRRSRRAKFRSEEAENDGYDPAMVAGAKNWIKEFAEKSLNLSYEDLMGYAERFLDGEYVIIDGGVEVVRGGEYARDEWGMTSGKFWDYYEIVMGKKPNHPEYGPGGFTCVC